MTPINNVTIITTLPLSELSMTRSRFEFSSLSDYWQIPDTTRLHVFNFSFFRSLCTDEVTNSFKMVLLWYLKNRSVSHASNLNMQFKWFVEDIHKSNTALSSIDSHHIISYKGNLSKNKEYYLGGLSGFLRKWKELGYPGIATNTYALLKELRLQGNKKGWPILTFDPEEGPFVEIELHAIHQAVNSAYAKGEIGNREFSLIWLFMATGARPVQIAALKLKDFIVQNGNDGKPVYFVNMPRAKQRNTLMRRFFKARLLIPEIGEVLEAWVAQVKLKHIDKIKVYETPDELPMFPAWGCKNVPGFEYHSNSETVRKEMIKVFSLLNVNSHRTGQSMHVTPRRFRYTLGTRTAMEKRGPMVIAEILDHTDTQNVGPYVKCVPEIIEHLDKALAMELAPFAAAFVGKIITDDSQTEHSNDTTSLIRYPKIIPSTGCVGRCVNGCAECGAMMPVACYVCRDFQAWADAPHEEVLNDLTEERKRILEETSDSRIAYANDNVILAVSQVILMCNEMKEVAGG